MKKVGSITTAIGLLGLGLVLLIGQLYPEQTWAADPLQWWPLLLIGLGIELLFWRGIKRQSEMKIDPLIMVFLVVVFGAGLYSQARVHILDSGILGWKYTSTQRYEVKDSTAGIEALEVRAPDGEIILTSSSSGEFRVQSDLTVRSNRKEDLPKSFLKMDREGQRLLVTFNNDSLNQLPTKQETITRIELPPGLPVRIEGRSGELTGRGLNNPLVLEKEYGEIELSNLEGALTIRADSGEITVRELAGNASVRLNNGQVNAEQVAGLQIALDSGDINVIEATGSVDITNQSGSINLNNPQGLRGDCKLHTGSGSIEFFAGQLADCHLVASSGSGEVVVPLYLDKPENREITNTGQKYAATVGPGTRTIDLSARQGSITVR
jgi:hypothetical protein